MITTGVTILVLAAVGYVLVSRWHGRPIDVRRLLLLPAILSGYGLLQFTGAAGKGLRAVDVAAAAYVRDVLRGKPVEAAVLGTRIGEPTDSTLELRLSFSAADDDVSP